MGIKEDIQNLDPGARVEFYELDLTQITRNSADKFYFHSGTNGLGGDVVWQGKTYVRFPIQATGFEASTKGVLPRPSLAVSNVTNMITALAKAYDDLIGAKVTRRRTLARYLDAVNFPARRNLLVNSNAFSRWGLINSTVTFDADLGPDGTGTADLLLPNTTNGGHYAYMGAGTFSVGQTVTFSVYVKAGALTKCQIRFYPNGAFLNSAPPYSMMVFDAVTGEISNTSFLASTPVVSKVNDSWWRVSITAVTNATGSAQPNIIPYKGSAISYAGNGVDGIYVANAQLETGAVASAYQEIKASFSQNQYADPNQYLPDDVYFIERKVREDRNAVEFELSSSMDMQGQQLPSRRITTSVCQWEYRRVNAAGTGWEYAAYGCPYTGSNMFDENGNQVYDRASDACSKMLNSGCKKRYPQLTDVLPFGAFPGSKAYKF